ncbi:GNAT family N-acetyltransferase [Paenibacillus segetis]|uniref:N-acetyltransferase domain-containing protein n=1 Tax=Paenibacillus segetis TaxID=1325360 RepID=A0ABQ1YGA4_9BACL|nr:GNAT family N-acetyltransferase [Paenibacillus segetis]GGH24329.1 hypothetical protein GCM10008013_24030 [Paenibacillus segetis]
MDFRRVTGHELGQAAALANKVFCKDGEQYMGSAFPTIFEAGVSHSYGAFNEKGDLVAFMGMVPQLIRSNQAELRVFFIGAVCTDPDYRGRGLASNLLTLCSEHAKDAGASLMFISGDLPLYTNAGSVYYGKSTQFIIDAPVMDKLAAEHNAWNFRDMQPEDIFVVHELLTSQTGTIKWGIPDLQQAISVAPMAKVSKLTQAIRVAEIPGKGIRAVVVLGLPKSATVSEMEPTRFDGTVIEWAGSPEAVATLLSHSFLHFNLSSLQMNLPWQYTQLAASLKSAGAQSTESTNAGTVLVVDKAALITQASLDANVAQDLTYAELCSLLFDPSSEVFVPGYAKVEPLPLPYMYGLHFV